MLCAPKRHSLNIKWYMLGYGHMENMKNLWGSNGQCGGLQSHYNNTVSVIHYWMSLQRRALIKVFNGSADSPLYY